MTSLNNQVIDAVSMINFQDGSKLIDFISNIIVKEQDIGFSIDITKHGIDEGKRVKVIAEKIIQNIGNIGKINIILTRDNPYNHNKSTEQKKIKHNIDGVKKIILVAAGKGGVGKSTMSVLIAEHLQLIGNRVGIVDADIYGPSIPSMFNLFDAPQIVDKKMIPLTARNIEVNSLGFLVKDQPIAWRGPMASKAIFQLLSLTAWNNLDYLIIDTPPGTGDIHLALLENYNIAGVIVITTPQKIAEIDVSKAIELYLKFNVLILGIIENMSNTNNISLFKGESGKNLAKKYNIPLIAQVPIITDIAVNCDNGQSIAYLFNLILDDVVAQISDK
ncbi:MAG: sodium:proton antiporter [Rickettsiaceae bacterium]|nr:MAG: sodium:proton antiporter [Rickettsiaceae bacterium]